MNIKVKFSLIILLGTLVITSCKKDKTEPADDVADLLPLDTAAITGAASWFTLIGSNTTLPYFPDANSNYSVYKYIKSDKNTRVRIKGNYGEARYMSFNFYDGNSGNSFTSIKDVSILPVESFSNPYLTGFNGSNDDEYVITILHEGDTSIGDNVIVCPDDVDTITIFLRYYLPQGTDNANVDMPIIEAFDISTNFIVSFPEVPARNGGVGIDYDETESLYDITDNTIRAYRFPAANLFANLDNDYLILPISIDTVNEVVLLKIETPSFASTYVDNLTADVRYFSFNQGNHLTRNFAALHDEQLKPKLSDNFSYILISTDLSLKSKADELGITFFEWKVDDTRMLLLYRNLVTNSQFNYSLTDVALFDISQPQVSKTVKNAKNFIGNYAPQGVVLSKTSFLSNNDVRVLIP